MHALYYWIAGFVTLEFLGDVYPGFIDNDFCFALLGCNVGIVGYDGLLHFISGICVGFGILLAHKKGYLKKSGARAFFLWSLGIALAWELLEWSYDLVRIYIFHMDLFTMNKLTQPNGIDTLGDIILALLGTAMVFWWARRTAAAQVAVSA
ncbi:MAG: hypothetical protein JWL87_696 [Candidatus Adlerbacteria bacterium]|nr:hypothetical protein [Candidatus Adlerbacteria bacterium]